MINEDHKDFHELMMNYFQGSMSEQDYEQLLFLVNSNEVYKEKFLEMKMIRAKSFIPHFEDQKNANYQQLLHTLNLKPVKTLNRYIATFKWAAAVIVLCVISSLVSLYVYQTSDNIRQESFICETVVPLGSQVQVYLPDSSVVHLNSGSILRYNSAYNKNNREIYLNGEGYFTVQKNKDIPFLVKAGDLNIKVLGTTFNVKAYEEDSRIEVGLIKGSINVFTQNEYSNNRILAPNEHLIYNKLTRTIHTSGVDAQSVYQWTSGVLYFNKSSLADIFKALERKFNVTIEIDSKQIVEDYFTGNINTELTVTEMIDFLDVEKKYIWKKDGKTIYIRDK